MSKKFPDLRSDEEADAWLQSVDLSEYDLSGMKKVRFERTGFHQKGSKWPACHISPFVKELKNDLAGTGNAPVRRSVLADQAGERLE